MMKINRSKFDRNDAVKKLSSVAPPLLWDPKRKWEIKINGEKFNLKKQILPLLLEVTKKHCAFCDFYPLESDFFDIPIEHFEPKSTYPQKGYAWDNLFPVCHGCTRDKGDQFDAMLLRPDDDSYDFDIHFKIDAHTGKLISKTENGSVTLKIYNLNRTGLRTFRFKYISKYSHEINIIKSDDYPFRFLMPIFCKYKNPNEIINKYFS